MSSQSSSLNHRDEAHILKWIKDRTQTCNRLWGELDPEAQRALFGDWQTASLEDALILNVMDELLWVVIVGGTNVGKSTLFNLICGASLSPVKVTASATKYPLVCLPQRVFEHYRDGSPLGELTPCPHPDTLITPHHQTHGPIPIYVSPSPSESMSNTNSMTEQLQTTLDGVALIDCPDHDSSRQENARVAMSVAQRADLCLYITTPQKYKSASTINMITSLLHTDQEVWVTFNLATTEQIEGFEVLCHDLRADISAALPMQDRHLMSLLKFAGILPRVTHQTELIHLQSQVRQLLSFLVSDPPQQRKQQRYIKRLRGRCLSLRHQVHALLTHRKRHIAEFVAELQRSVAAFDFEHAGHGEQLMMLIDENAELHLIHLMSQKLERGFWSLMARIRPVHLRERFIPLRRSYALLLFKLSSWMYRIFAYEQHITLQTSDGITFTEPNEYDRCLRQLSLRESAWSQIIYTEIWTRSLIDQNGSDVTLKQILGQMRAALELDIASIFQCEFERHIKYPLINTHDEKSGGVNIAQVLISISCAFMISGLTGWLISMVSGLFLDVFLSTVVVAFCSIIIGVLSFDITSFFFSLRAQIHSGVMMKELERIQLFHQRCKSHQAVWREVSQQLPQYLETAPVNFTYTLGLIEHELEQLERLTGRET